MDYSVFGNDYAHVVLIVGKKNKKKKRKNILSWSAIGLSSFVVLLFSGATSCSWNLEETTYFAHMKFVVSFPLT